MMFRTGLGSLLLGVLLLGMLSVTAGAVESLHMGYDSANFGLTDAIRLSTRIGTIWWSKEVETYNPENGTWMSYAYHDGYFDLAGHTASELAARWDQIINGGGDPWVPDRLPGQGHYPGNPNIIVLDEISGSQSDATGGQYLLDALSIYCSNYGNRDHIMAYLSPGVTQTSSPSGSYSKVVTCGANYLRRVCLELYLSHESYVTGNNNGNLNPTGLQGDAYLNGRLGNPIKRWIDAGVPASRVMPILAVSNIAESHGTTAKSYYKFLNRQFWWMANGRWGSNQTGNAGIKTALRGGVGSYSWSPGTDSYGWCLTPSKTTRDEFHEKYIMWYSVGGNTNAHSDGVDAM